MSQYRPELVIIFIFFHICLIGPALGQTEEDEEEVASPFVLFGPHGYRTFEHSRCQNVPTVDVDLGKISGTWYLVKYVNSHDGKPTGGHTPYLCPEARMTFESEGKVLNISQLSYEHPVIFLDQVEWEQHPNKTGVFFHEENIFSLWTIKVMHLDDKNMVFFLCIDYTIWPGWNHRGVYVLSRTKEQKEKVRRQLSNEARKRMKMHFDRRVNTTSCDPDDWEPSAIYRWHPHKYINRSLYQASIVPYMSRKYRRNKNNL